MLKGEGGTSALERRTGLTRRTPLKAKTVLGRSSGLKRTAPADSERWRNCIRCGKRFYDAQANGVRQRYCSARCFGDAQSESAQETYPSREQLAREYCDEGLSLAALGKRHGHTYTWAARALKSRGIATRNKDQAAKGKRKPLNQRNDRGRWGIHLKPSDYCRNCGRSGGILHLHHVIPRSKSAAAKYDLRNGLQLCPECHAGWHRLRVVIYRDVLTSQEWDFVSNVQLVGESTTSWLDKRYPRRPVDGSEVVPTCERGHELTPENIYVINGRRRCRACDRDRAREYRISKRHWMIVPTKEMA